RPHPPLLSFPTRRSSDLAPSAPSRRADADEPARAAPGVRVPAAGGADPFGLLLRCLLQLHEGAARGPGAPPAGGAAGLPARARGDRKSTRLNSSHLVISY